MLSRNAANLYWLGRNTERADYLCRLIDATVRLSALPATHGGSDTAWEAALQAAGAAWVYQETGRRMDQESVGHFLSVDPANPSSIRALIDNARTNARTVRTALT
ncbi:MAG: alpha-E domain-containing protein, partial [Thermaurantiacus sp.]